MSLRERFEKFDDDFLKFSDIANPMHRRPDICAFLMIDAISPGLNDIVQSAGHDVIYLDGDIEDATDEQIRDLRRCGVFYDGECECLSMFV